MMPDPLNFAVIPTNGRACYKDCVASIQDQVGQIILVEGGSHIDTVHGPYPTMVIRETELNISKWWNRALVLAEKLAKSEGAEQWNVAILNDDTIIPPGWMETVSLAMREENAAAACSGGTAIPYRIVHREPGPVGLISRMKGFAFILAGEKGLRANEQLRWYFSDDHVDWMARRLGGMVVIPGFPVEHLYPNQQVTPEIQQIIAEDAQSFQGYWGMRPW